MGAIISTVDIAVSTLAQRRSTFSVLRDRIKTTPGKPVADPTSSAWQLPLSPLASHTSKTCPDAVDVLIIGSGITACSVAYHLLKGSAADRPTVAIFEARDLCGGGTARNGGHIKETPYLEFEGLVKRFGQEAAEEAIRFRLGHLKMILDIAEKEGLSVVSEAREVETVDVYSEPEIWRVAQEKLQSWLKAFPEEVGRWKVWQGEELKTVFSLPTALGVITGPAGALAPYRLITEIYSKLLKEFPGFTIDCNTPIETIQGTPLNFFRRPVSLDPYQCFTFKDSSHRIRATHVVHANNGFVSRLIPGLRGKIIPARGQMTAQRLFPPGVELPGGANRSWSFIWNQGFDYMTIRPDGNCMLGGGWARGPNNGLDALATTAENRNTILESAYLGGLLPTMFSGLVTSVRVEDSWTGIMGFSVDSLPWVGEVPESIAGNRVRGSGKEWVSAGYSGEGMVNAWGCGKGLAAMIRNEMFGEEQDIGIPGCMLVTEKRVKRASTEMMVEDWM